jgi:hypothetical protein
MFDELIAAGGDLGAAKSLCQNELVLPEGRELSTYRIKVHTLQHTRIDPERIHPSFMKSVRRDPAEVAEERKEKATRAEVVNTYVSEMAASVDIDGILSELGIPRRPRTLSDVLTVAQEISAGLNVLAGVIAYDRLRKHAADPEGTSYPTSALKGAELTSQMMSGAFGFNAAVSIQTSIDTLERAGYTVVERGAESDKQLPPSVG